MQAIKNSRGQGLTEYLILMILIAIVAIGASQQLGTAIKGRIDSTKEHINAKLKMPTS